jgi:hypothetical protein
MRPHETLSARWHGPRAQSRDDAANDSRFEPREQVREAAGSTTPMFYVAHPAAPLAPLSGTYSSSSAAEDALRRQGDKALGVFVSRRYVDRCG